MTLRTTFLLLTAVVTLTSCAQSKPAPTPPGLRYLEAQPLRLNVSSIEVVKAYDSPKQAPYVDHKFPIPPVATIEQWARDRLQAGGSTGRAVLTIEDASVREHKLPKTGSIKGSFTVDQSERYDMNLRVKLEILDGRGYTASFVKAGSSLSRSVPEDISLYNRTLFWTKLLEDAMNALDSELSKNAQQYLAPGF